MGQKPAAFASFGRAGRSWSTSLFPADLDRVKNAVENALKGRQREPVEYRMLTESADIIWVRHWFDGGGRHGSPKNVVTGAIQIIDEQKRLEAECLLICDRERRTIGQELHDDHCQLLAGLASMLRGVERGIDEKDVAVKQSIEELIGWLKVGMGRVRSLAHGLVPWSLTDSGLRPAFVELAKTCSEHLQVEVVARFDRRLPAHSPAQVFQLYRIAQEAISNAVKHGKASRIQLCLRSGRRGIWLTICDNGIGLPHAKLRRQGVGLQIMTYRAAQLGGAVSLRATRGGGATVAVNYECRGKI